MTLISKYRGYPTVCLSDCLSVWLSLTVLFAVWRLKSALPETLNGSFYADVV